MAAGSLTLGGNLSIAVGPLGRNGEAIGALSSKGKVAAMYTYSKTRGLFGGVSLEGSVIMERQDANAQAYRSDVTAKMLLSGSVPPPEWVQPFIRTLESCTGLPGNRRWVNELNARSDEGYVFGGVESPRDENGSSSRSRPGMGSRKDSHGSYFDFNEDSSPTKGSNGTTRSRASTYSTPRDRDEPTTDFFDTRFESDFKPNAQSHKGPRPNFSSSTRAVDYPFKSTGSDASTHKRSVSAYTPPSSSRFNQSNPFDDGRGYNRRTSYDFDHHDVDEDRDVFGAQIPSAAKGFRGNSPPAQPKLAPKAELTRPLQPHEGIARAIALFDFNAVQSGDLSFKKGQVITVTEMSKNTDTWWSGKVEGRTGMFPANFVEVV